MGADITDCNSSGYTQYSNEHLLLSGIPVRFQVQQSENHSSASNTPGQWPPSATGSQAPQLCDFLTQRAIGHIYIKFIDCPLILAL